MPFKLWIRPLTLTALLLCFTVIVLGAYVRLTAAGLGCPDWPGCYGHVTPLGAQHSAAAQAAFPQRPLEVGKAWREMIHRYAAATLGLMILIIAFSAVARRRERIVSVGLACALVATVLFQGMLGMLTVTWRLKPLIVTSHLMFGLTTLGLLWWLWLAVRDHGATARKPHATGGPASAAAASLAWKLTLAGLIALTVQIALGGWTSSNYAAVACPDFPTCQNSWWPHADFHDAFILWRGLGSNYEGGVLDNPARIAVHLTHRLGALVATITLSTAALLVLTRGSLSGLAGAALGVFAALGLQLVIGISMVEKGFPLWLATAHTAGAALLLLCVLNLLRALGLSASGRPI